jgi:hypothetical protein
MIRADVSCIGLPFGAEIVPRIRLSGPSMRSVAGNPFTSAVVIVHVPRGSICGGRVTP